MSRLPRVALWLVLAAYVLPLALPVPLMEDDEGLHAAIAIEMVERGDWVVPRFMGEPFLDKPVLYFWMQAASLAVFGASEFAVRLPGTLMALAGAGAIGWLSGAMFGAGVGTWAALCYATMLLPYAVSLAPLHDLVMVPLVTVALGAFWHARDAVSALALVRWTVVAGVALGLSMLGKGLTGVGLAGVATVVWLVWSRAFSWRLVAAGAGALVLASVMAWPWYAAMEGAVPGYLHYFLMERHVAGVTADTQRHAGRPIWYYLPIVLAGAWPWILFAVRRGGRPMRDSERLLWAWFVADVVVLSLAGSKLATYVLPALPALAALAAMAIVRTPDGAPVRGGLERLGLVASGATALVPLGAVVALLLTAPGSVPTLPSLLWIAGPVFVFGGTLLHRRDGRAWIPAEQLLIVTAATLVATTIAVLPAVAGQLSARTLAAQLNAAGTLPARVWVVDEGVGSLVFYLRPEWRRQLVAGRIARISRFSLADLPDPPDAVVAVASDRVPGVAELVDLDGVDRPSGGQYLVLPLAEVRRRLRPSAGE